MFSILYILLFPSDETEYEYSGSEEEDEERDTGEPRSVSSQMYTDCITYFPKYF